MPSHGLLTYPVPISLTAAPPDVTGDADLAKLVDNLFANSIRQFHEKAGEADVGLSRELRKPMSAQEREWHIRAHTVLMEQTARDIVERRDALLGAELSKRSGGSHGRYGSGPTPMPAKAPVAPQPPGAFPDDDGVRVTAVPNPEPVMDWNLEPEPEPEREPEPDVDEVIEVPLKGKAAKKKAKKAGEAARAATANGRATPAAAPKAVPTAPKAAPAPPAEKRAAPSPPAWGAAAKTAAANMRSASPALTIDTKVSPAPLGAKVAATPTMSPAPPVVSRGTAIPPGMSPWQASQAAKAAKAAVVNGDPQEPVKPPSPPNILAKPPSPPSPANGMWAPPPPIQTRTSGGSGKNPYAPARPSRLGQHVSEPEPPSPEPPSPPPTREPTGSDYVAWFAGSSSEDEGGAEEGGLSEGEDDEEDEDESAAAGGFGGGLLASLAGASPWALFGAGAGGQPPRERGRTASPARGRATPTPAKAVAARFGGAEAASAPVGGEWMRWGAGPSAPTGFGTSPPGHGFGFGTGTSPPGHEFAGFGAGPSVPRRGRGTMGGGEDDGLDMLNVAAEALHPHPGGRRDGSNVEDVMAMYVKTQMAREADRKSTRLNSSHSGESRMPSSA